MAIFKGTIGKDKFIGENQDADVFRFSTADFNYNDKIIGGGKNESAPLDRLVLTGNPGVNLDYYLIGDAEQISGIEVLEFADTGIQLNLGWEFFDQSSNGEFTIYGGDGNDVVVLAERQWDHQIEFTEVTFYGGRGDDNCGVTTFLGDRAFGEDGNDVLTGGAGYLDGGAGDDILSSTNAATIVGGSGSDLLSGGAGSTLDGGDGFDFVVAVDGSILPANTSLLSIEGIAVYRVQCSTTTLLQFKDIAGLGSDGQNRSQAEFLFTKGRAIDFRDFNLHFEKLIVNCFGSRHDFKITGADIAAIMTGGIGQDRLTGGNADDEILGGQGDDVLYGSAGNDFLAGGDGSDTVDGGAGYDTISVGYQNPTIVPAIFDTYFGGDGVDRFYFEYPGVERNAAIDGGSGFDTIEFRSDANLLGVTVTGIELVNSGYGNVIKLTADTYAGIQKIDLGRELGQAPSELVIECYGGGTFHLEGKLASLEPRGHLVAGSEGNFVFVGTNGDDAFSAARGYAKMYGGDGDDVFYSSNVFDMSSPDLANGNSGNDSFYSFENGERLLGGRGNDTFHDCACNLDGGKGYDVVIVSQVLGKGSFANVELLRSTSFIIKAEASALAQFDNFVIDQLISDLGYLDVTGSERFDLSKAAHGFQVYSSEPTTALNFRASNFADQLGLTPFDDSIDAGGGDDSVSCGNGNDAATGGGGRDHVFGHEGDDNLSGGAGDDVLFGGLGADVLSGGTGNDSFVFWELTEGPDVIDDFEQGVDVLEWVIDLPWGNEPDGTGPLLSKLFQSSTTNGASNSDVRFVYDRDDGQLYLDADGNKSGFAPVLLITFTNKPNLVASDFLIL